ncbi:CsbD-like family [Cyanobium sp. PCC 7001]|nr:CsbD-like family [Cyanobium sp. PCC 7001]
MAVAVVMITITIPLAGTALAASQQPQPITLLTMSNKLDATAKNAEGRLESAYGELTGDTGHQIKGKAKQVQASAMNLAEDVKDAAKSAGKNVSDAAGKMADDVS